MFDAVLQALVNGVIAGALLAIPAIGFSAIFAVLRFPNFAIGALATAGAYFAWIANVNFGLPDRGGGRRRLRECGNLRGVA